MSNILNKLAGALVGISENDLTVAERRMYNVLETENILVLNDLNEVVFKEVTVVGNSEIII